MPRHMLFSNEMDSIVTKHFALKSGWIRSEVNVDVKGLPEGMNVVYFYNKTKNAIVIPSPLATKEGEGDATEPTYEGTIAAISRKIANDSYSVCSSLLGKGAGELHYTALYCENVKDGKISIFDSKISEPNRFLHSSNAPTILEKAWGYLTAPFKVFGLWAFNIGKQVNSTFLSKEVTIHRLGTQPILDGVSCGLHSTGAVLLMADLIDNDKGNTEQITSAVMNGRNLDVVAETILNDKKDGQKIPLVSTALTAVAKRDDAQLSTTLLPRMEEIPSQSNDNSFPPKTKAPEEEVVLSKIGLN